MASSSPCSRSCTFSCSLEFAAKADRKQTHDDAVYAHGHRLAGVGAHSVYWSSRGSRLAHAPDVYCRSWRLLCFLTFSYRNVELGQAYPILRGTGPIVVFLASMIFLNEPVSEFQLFAFFLIAGGILSLSLRSFGYFQKQPSTIFYALGTGVLIGIYSLIDGIGVRNSGNILGYICWLFFLEMLMVQAYAFYYYRGDTIPRLFKLGWSGVWAGLLAAYAYGSVLWAMGSAPIMLVAALRETSVVMASVLGILILRKAKTF